MNDIAKSPSKSLVIPTTLIADGLALKLFPDTIHLLN